MPEDSYDRVIAQPGAIPASGCKWCGAPLRKPRFTGREVLFCKGSKCRSAWHKHKRDAAIAKIKGLLAELHVVLEELR